MVFFLLVTTVVSVLVATVCLALMVERFSLTKQAIRRWRIVWSKRKQVSNAEIKARKAAEAMQHHKQVAEEAKRSAQMEIANAKDVAEQAQRQAEESVASMGGFVIAERFGEIAKTIKADNYHAKEKQVMRAVNLVAKNGYHLPDPEQKQLACMLKEAHEKAKRVYAEKVRQAEIKAQIREEEREARERQRAIREAEAEAKRKQQALEEALRLLGDTHSDEIEKLKQELAEAQEKATRAISMAQQTKSGHVYVISNVGSFGQDVYKVGMTRRLEPMDRVKELGDASVPFSFDVHAMIACDDAPALEAALHRDLDKNRVNKVNLRKEYFRVDLETIIGLVAQHHGQVEYIADPEALEWRESLAIEEDTEDVSEDLATASMG